MKKLLLFAGLLLALSTAVFAQDCATGYCPSSITVHHKAGMVSPITADITYGVVSSTLSGAQKCWITQDLGATSMATSSADVTTAARGWYWQWGLAQGYQYNSSLVPAATWITPTVNALTSWSLSIDPCRMLLGGTWRIPTKSEWSNFQASNTTVAAAYASVLKLHIGGYLNTAGGYTSSEGDYWASDATATLGGGGGLQLVGTVANNVTTWSKAYGFYLRCLRDF